MEVAYRCVSTCETHPLDAEAVLILVSLAGPGRVFAKQEGLGAIAMILSRFDFEVKGFADERKKPTTSFPGYAKACGGSGALVPGGDMKVKVRRRERSG